MMPTRLALDVEFAVALRNRDALEVAALVGRDNELVSGFVHAHQKLLIRVIVVHAQFLLGALGNICERHEVHVIAHLHGQVLLRVVHNHSSILYHLDQNCMKMTVAPLWKGVSPSLFYKAGRNEVKHINADTNLEL